MPEHDEQVHVYTEWVTEWHRPVALPSAGAGVDRPGRPRLRFLRWLRSRFAG